MTDPKWTAVSHNYDLITNNEKTVKKADVALLEQAKSELLGTLDTLDFESTLVNRCILAKDIADNRFNKGYETGRGIPQGTINLREDEPKMPVNLDEALNGKYSDLKKEYEDLINSKPSWFELELKKLDTRLAERIILDNLGSIEFRDGDDFLDKKSAKEESQDSFDGLNGMKEYAWKIELISRKQWKINYYVIKWTEKQMKQIRKRYSELKTEASEKINQENDDLRKENDELRRQLDELSAKNKDREGKDEAAKKLEEENQELRRQIDELKKPKTDEKKEKDESEDLKKQNEELRKQIDELKKAKDNEEKKDDKGKNTEETAEEEKSDENKPEKDKNDLNVIVEEQRKRIVYLEGLLKWDESKSSKEEEEDDSGEDIEQLEENLLYVSRRSVEESILRIRRKSWYPSGVIEIRWESIHVEEFEFYEELKSEYIEAKWDEKRLSELDKEFAELVILFSPMGSEEKDRYTIKLTDEEIKRWLYVSKERLERYGLVINFHDYYERIVEREYREKIKIVKHIETEIKELSTTIIELTRKITIEKSSTEEILLEIKSRKERIMILKDKLYKLLLSLKAWNKPVDRELLSLKERQTELEDELDKLRKQKKHQDDVNKEIQSLEKEIAKLEKKPNNDKVNEDIQKKQNELKELKAHIGSLKKDKEELLSRLNSDKVTDLEKIDLRERLNKLNKAIEKYENDAKKLSEEIKKLKDQADNGDEKVLKEIEKLREEEQKTQELIWELEWQEWETWETPIWLVWLRAKLEEIQKQIKEKEKLLWWDDENLKSLKDRLNKLKEEQKWFDKDIDKKIADKEKELKDIKDRIREKEENSRRRIVVATFDDGDFGAWFAKHCEENGIKRKDGKEIPWTWGLDPSATYVDKDWRELKLEPKTWANDDGYDNPITYYELVYYEETWNWEVSEIEIQLEAIIHEQEILLVELTELEEKLRIAKSKKEKIEIEEKIKIINEKLTIISQKITEFTTIIREYKQTIRVRRYRLYSVTAFSHTWPVPTKWLELNSVISDMWTDVFREKAALKVEEELKRRYKSLWRWQMWSRLCLFLWRWSRRRSMMRTEMNNMANTAFQTRGWYASLNDQSQNAADRHAHELLTGMAAVNRISTVHNPQIDKLCKDYLNGSETDASFQQKFNAIVASDTNIQSILSGNNITHIGTNILLQLKEQRALNILITTLDWQLQQYINTGNSVYMNNMQNYVEQYIKDYQKLPVFKATFEQFVKWDLNARNQLKRYLAHQKAIMKMQIANLTMNIDIVNKWKSAYQTDNKDREQGWKYKLWHFLDKHPRWTLIWTAALSVWLWFATAWISSAVAGAAITTWVFGSYVWFTNYIKKWTHYTKEQNTHEKNVVTDYTNEGKRIQNWQNEALNGHGWKKYKAKRQLALYHQTTQENIQFSDQIAGFITDLSAKTWPLTTGEENFMKLNLIEWWARLQYYKQIWHNFLASQKVDETEKDMKKLEKAITLWLQKIGKTANDIQNTMSATNSNGANVTYAVIQNELKTSYDKSLIQFKRERRWLALRYGIWTAALSIGTAVGMQALFHTWMFAKGTPATNWTPWTPSSTTNHNWWIDNFKLWKDEVLLPGEMWYISNPSGIHDATLSALSGVPNWSTITFTYWVWTDATPVIAWHLTPADLATKISSVSSSISGMSWLTGAQKASFLSELSSLSHTWFTNNNLASMRAAEYLQHCAQAMADHWNGTLIPTFSRTLDASGWAYNNIAQRFMKGAIKITTPAIPGTKWTPAIPAKTRWRWIMWLPLYFNTFKDRKKSKDTTDQNFGGGNQNSQKTP